MKKIKKSISFILPFLSFSLLAFVLSTGAAANSNNYVLSSGVKGTSHASYTSATKRRFNSSSPKSEIKKSASVGIGSVDSWKAKVAAPVRKRYKNSRPDVTVTVDKIDRSAPAVKLSKYSTSRYSKSKRRTRSKRRTMEPTTSFSIHAEKSQIKKLASGGVGSVDSWKAKAAAPVKKRYKGNRPDAAVTVDKSDRSAPAIKRSKYSTSRYSRSKRRTAETAASVSTHAEKSKIKKLASVGVSSKDSWKAKVAAAPVRKKYKGNRPDLVVDKSDRSAIAIERLKQSKRSKRSTSRYSNSKRQKAETAISLFTHAEFAKELKEELAALRQAGDLHIDGQKKKKRKRRRRRRRTISRVRYSISLGTSSHNETPSIAVSDSVEKTVETAAKTEKFDDIVYDFPVVINDQVEFYLKQFQNKRRKMFQHWLERSAIYLPFISKELKKAELPQSLICLAMIESGFRPSAYSQSHAAGLWQFIPSTGKHYGLRINEWVDERRDPEKATKAAVSYLKALYKRFGDWQLATAAYNAGEGTIERGLRKYNAKNFWELAEHDYLSRETKNYVPKLIAAIILAADPAKYGFKNLQYKKPAQYDLINVPCPADIGTIAAGGSCSVEDIRKLNNELLKNQLPPREGGYTVKVPAGSQKRITTNLLIAQNVKNKRTIMHKLRKGETLSEVVEKYDVPIALMKRWNDIQNVHNVQAGQKLTVYLEKEADTESVSSPTIAIDKIVETELPGTIILADSKKMKPNAENNRTKNKIAVSYYKVRNGDSLWSIAQKLQVSTREIKRWNSLNNNLLHPGKRLVIKKS